MILLIDVLQDVNNRVGFFDEVHRMLKADGIVAIYPMNLAEEEVERLAVSRRFFLEEENSRPRPHLQET